MAIRQQANRWRTDALSELDELLGAAILDPTLPGARQGKVGSAGRLVLEGIKEMVVATSSSNPGYELRDIPAAELDQIDQITHKIGLLKKLGEFA